MFKFMNARNIQPAHLTRVENIISRLENLGYTNTEARLGLILFIAVNCPNVPLATMAFDSMSEDEFLEYVVKTIVTTKEAELDAFAPAIV